LALAVADEVWMLENAVYSILSPEGFASILWKDSGRAMEAAALMKMTSEDLFRQEIIERIIPEPEVFTVQSMYTVSETLEVKIAEFLETYMAMDPKELLERRYERFRRM
jgi:acetyl-CoA carboxylase carboxyl transferase subunit beta